MNDDCKIYGDLIEKLRDKSVVIGFDGFIDTIVRPIQTGASGSNPLYFHTMDAFGRFVAKRSGRSASVELDLFEERVGGNAPNTALGLKVLGSNVRLIGSFGYPLIHPKFQEVFSSADMLSATNPGHAIACEFEDGKLMCALNHEVNTLDWTTLIRRVDPGRLRAFFAGCSLAVFVNWSEMRQAQQLWEGAYRYLLAEKSFPEWMLFDLSDCARKTREELQQVAQLIRQYAQNSKVVISLNENEKDALGKALFGSSDVTPCALSSSLNACAVVFHFHYETCTYSEGSTTMIRNHFVKKPTVSTGGGDSFNAGLCAGLLAGMPLDEAAKMGSLCGSYFVENGHYACAEALERYAKKLRKL